jgi:hypothetical protein
VLLHINLQDESEILLVICHCYLYKPGQQAVCVINLL